jgi:hypothetical protein
MKIRDIGTPKTYKYLYFYPVVSDGGGVNIFPDAKTNRSKEPHKMKAYFTLLKCNK